MSLHLWLILLGAGWPVTPLYYPQLQQVLHFLAYLLSTIQGIALAAPAWGITT